MSESRQIEKTVASDRVKPQKTEGLIKNIIQVLKKMELETWIGGIAATVAVIAVFFEVVFNGFSPVSVAAGIKDFSTTFVAAIVLIVAVRKLKPKKIAETYEEVLEEELEKMVKRNDPMIQRIKWVSHIDPLTQKAVISIPKPEDPIQYNMITDHEIMFHTEEGKGIDEIRNRASIKSTDRFAGLFMDLPDQKRKYLKFYLNKSTFIKRIRAGETYETVKARYSSAIPLCIMNNFPDLCESAKAAKSEDEFSVKFKDNKLKTPDDARELVRLIEYVMHLYFLAA